jgi:stage II sporulation protein GA (sporulation sigma-E factor processing peptidase)
VTIYVDVLIVINTLVNYFILLAVRKITRSYTRRWRLVIGALCGGLSSLLIFIENLGIVMTFFKIITALLTIAVTFGVKPFKHFLKRTFFLFAITFIFGGFALAVYMFFDRDVLLYSNGIVYFDVNMTFLVVCSVISYIIITIVSNFMDKKAPKNKEYIVSIDNDSNSICCVGLMDTGNNLRDPFSGYPVIMAEKEIIEKLFDNEKIRYIPVSTVSGESIIKAFKPQKLTVNNYSTDKVYIGESLTPLGEYKIILNINLEGEMHND